MIRVLFVCAGNTCRSPMAEALFRAMVDAAGLQGAIEIASAGVSAGAGDPVNPAAVRVLAAHGIAHDGQARRFEAGDFGVYDRIVPLDNATWHTLEAVKPAGSRAQMRPLMAYAPQAGAEEVFDPYDTDRYEEAFALIQQGVAGLLAAIRKDAGL